MRWDGDRARGSWRVPHVRLDHLQEGRPLRLRREHVEGIERLVEGAVGAVLEREPAVEARLGHDVAEGRRGQLDDLTVTIARKAGDEGRLFGSVGAVDIVDAVRAMGLELQKQEVRLPKGPFRAAGEYEVAVHLHPEVDANIKLEVVPEA